MRLLIAIVLVVYCVGVGVALAPIFQSGWYTQPAGELASNVVHALPDALAWPAKVYRGFTGHSAAAANS